MMQVNPLGFTRQSEVRADLARATRSPQSGFITGKITMSFVRASVRRFHRID